jgi:hypothetical protein
MLQKTIGDRLLIEIEQAAERKGYKTGLNDPIAVLKNNTGRIGSD